MKSIYFVSNARNLFTTMDRCSWIYCAPRSTAVQRKVLSVRGNLYLHNFSPHKSPLCTRKFWVLFARAFHTRVELLQIHSDSLESIAALPSLNLFDSFRIHLHFIDLKFQKLSDWKFQQKEAASEKELSSRLIFKQFSHDDSSESSLCEDYSREPYMTMHFAVNFCELKLAKNAVK